jgi:predicted nucleic acid-binding protein
MLVVSDTSPVTALLQVGCAGLLPSLFGQVLIPPAVEMELLRFHAGRIGNPSYKWNWLPDGQ